MLSFELRGIVRKVRYLWHCFAVAATSWSRSGGYAWKYGFNHNDMSARRFTTLYYVGVVVPFPSKKRIKE
ncbi:MAG: hypothetical protein QM610_04920 [Chitinophagaceae bacterium]